MCGLGVNPLVSRYLFLNVGWRGRGSPKPHKTDGFVFCGPCADQLLDRITPFAVRASVLRR